MVIKRKLLRENLPELWKNASSVTPLGAQQLSEPTNIDIIHTYDRSGAADGFHQEVNGP